MPAGGIDGTVLAVSIGGEGLCLQYVLVGLCLQ